jgi:hypothetical protein
VIKAAPSVVPAGFLDHDTTARDAIVELLKLLDALADLRLHGLRIVEIAERNLKWRLHDRPPI